MSRPKWVPKDAEAYGWKVLSPERKSLLPPDSRVNACEYGFAGDGYYGRILSYRHGEVIMSDFCDCDSGCCRGIHFFRRLNGIRDWLMEIGYLDRYPFIVVQCYVPNGETYLEFEDKCRASAIVCLDEVELRW